jgi:AAA+ ATPase superfamily predicted ATPase
LFEVEESDKVRDYLKAAVESLPNTLAGIPIPKQLFSKFFEEKEMENVFRYLETFFKRLSSNFVPVLIIDELQVIGDIKIDDLLIYRLFNFFVRLTKELHVCHVFAITSDSLFIERVYSEAMLQGRAEYLLVDDFDYSTTEKFLRKHGFDKKEIELVWNYFGGKPIYLLRAVRAKKSGEDLEEVVATFFDMRLSQIKDAIYELEGGELFDKVIELFKSFRDREEFKYEKLSDEIRFCVKKNILFADPIRRVVKPQSRLDLMAIRAIG